MTRCTTDKRNEYCNDYAFDSLSKGENDGPEAENDTATTTENASVNIDVLAKRVLQRLRLLSQA